MAYRFKLNESFQKGFHRVALGEIDKAVMQLAAGQDGVREVHEARKAMKRLRALLRLVRPALGADAFKARNAAARDIAQSLSGTRDRHVILDTLAKLRLEAPATGIGKQLLMLENRLRRDDAGQTGGGPGELASKALGLLTAERAELADIKLKGKGFAVVADGLGQSYRAGREAIGEAFASAEDEAFHDLRKGVQLQWRHMALLVRAWPESLSARIALARQLSQSIGDDHDLAVLINLVETSDNKKAAAAIVAMCRARQSAIRLVARPLAERLFAEKPDTFVERIASYWSTAREMKHRSAEEISKKSGGGDDNEPNDAANSPRGRSSNIIALR